MFGTIVTVRVPSPGEFWELSEGLSLNSAQETCAQFSLSPALTSAPAPGDPWRVAFQWAWLPWLVSLSSTPILASREHRLPSPLCSSMLTSAKLSQKHRRDPETTENNLKAPLLSVPTTEPRPDLRQSISGPLPCLPPGQPPGHQGQLLPQHWEGAGQTSLSI